MAGPALHPVPAQRGQGQHRGLASRIDRRQQIATVVVAKRELGDADDEVPPVLLGVRAESFEGDVDVFGSEGERLAEEFDDPAVGLRRERRCEIGHPTCDDGGRSRVRHEPHSDRLHLRNLHLSRAHRTGAN